MESWVAVGSSIFKKTTLFNNPPICTVYSGPDNEANVRLIAAAPETAEQRDELLEALEEIARFGEDDSDYDYINTVANAAISKAKGSN